MWFWIILLLVNALIGLFLFDHAWKQTEMHRTKDEERDANFPAWRRYDTHKWNKTSMMLMAVTVLPLRFLRLSFMCCA